MQTPSNAPLCEIENLRIGFPAHDGTLTEVPSSPTLLPVPNRTRPQGVVAF